MPAPGVTESYDEKIAASFLRMNEKLTGLPKLNLLAPVTVRIDVSNDGRVCAAAQGTVTLRPPRKPSSEKRATSMRSST